MLDMFHLAGSRHDVQVFTRPCTVTSTQWETWRKPRGAVMVYILCFGGGGGGGGGFTNAGVDGGGGGGGGSGGNVRVLVPAHLVPDVLYVQVGSGGTGSTSNGSPGVRSLIAIAPDTTDSNILARSSTNTPGGGGVGTGSAGGAGGAGGSITTIAVMPLAGLGHFALIAGQDGAAGGDDLGADGTAITIPVTSAMSQGGSGGAGAEAAETFAGGACTAITDSWLSEQRAATPAAGSNPGSGGVQCWKPFFGFGGLGGSANGGGAGGAGGNGAIGSGGGGGGSGTTGGAGGKGGDGIVIIIAW